MDILGDFKDNLRPKRIYRKRSNLSVSQRKHRDLPAPGIPTVEYKSPRDLRAEKKVSKFSMWYSYAQYC